MRRLPALLLVALAACSGDNPSNPPPAPSEIRLQEVAAGLQSPTHLTAPAGDARLFVVEQPGRIRVIENGALAAIPFLDITDRVGSGGERGLLSMAFHPRYAQNGLFFVYYTDRVGDIRVDRFRVSADRGRADVASARSIISIPHREAANHNGGLVAFGPDGYLYLGTGDGGGGGDPQRNGQDPASLLGKILRLDVNGAEPYAIPAGNPFEGRSVGRPEVWATGVRNPWRFSWDRETGLLYVADVGQGMWEEVDAVPATAAGLNYGWNVMEGAHCFAATTCDTTGKVLPVLEYGHGEGCSITGGHVYRGSDIPGLRGHYFYSDYCGGWVRSFRLEEGRVTDRREWAVGNPGNIISYGEDARGELYLLVSGGRVLRVVPGA